MRQPHGIEAEAGRNVTRRLSTRTLVYLLIAAFVVLTLMALALGLPWGGASPTEGRLPAV